MLCITACKGKRLLICFEVEISITGNVVNSRTTYHGRVDEKIRSIAERLTFIINTDNVLKLLDLARLILSVYRLNVKVERIMAYRHMVLEIAGKL